jgi:hypothetical protein
MNKKEAEKAYNLLKGKFNHRPIYLNYPSETSDVTGTVHYVGPMDDPAALFIFENAKKYIHQDVDPTVKIKPVLRALEKHKIIKDLEVVKEEIEVRHYKFKHNGKTKELIEYVGSKGDVTNPKAIPKHTLEAVLLKGMGHQGISKLAYIHLLPKLKNDGLITGAMGPLYAGESRTHVEAGLEDINPDDRQMPYTYVKREHKSRTQLENDLDYNQAKLAEEREKTAASLKSLKTGKSARELIQQAKARVKAEAARSKT